MAIRPPRDLTPAGLVRCLLATPRPVVPLAYRIASAPDMVLHARAMLPLEVSSMADYPRDVRALHVVAHGLCDAQARPLLTAADAGLLTLDEATKLAGEIELAQARIGFRYAVTFDVLQWETAAKQGMQTMPSLVRALGQCVRVEGRFLIGEPERYFGLPRRELTDGHWLLFYAALNHYSDAIERVRRE